MSAHETDLIPERRVENEGRHRYADIRPPDARWFVAMSGQHEVDAVVAVAVAKAAAVPLLLSAAGQPDRAWAQWLALRDSVDQAVARHLRNDRVETGQSLFAVVGAFVTTGAGDIEALIHRARDEAQDPMSRADAQRALAMVGAWRGDILRTAALTEQAADEVALFDGRREAELWLDAATMLVTAGHLGLAKRAARRAVETTERWPELASTAKALLDWVQTGQGQVAAVKVSKASTLDALSRGDVRLGVLGGSLLAWNGRHDEARNLLGRTEAAARTSAPEALPFVLATVADLDFRAGWWRSGRDAAEEGEGRAEQSGSRNVRALLLSRRARFDAACGDGAACLSRLAEAERIGQAGSLINVDLHAASVRTLLAMGEGDHERAVTHGERARRLAQEMSLGHPGYDPFHGDLIEALVGMGRNDDAADVVGELEATAIRLTHQPSLAVAARGRLLLGPDGLIEQLARRALAHHDEVPVPFERARTLLVVGERRRQARQRREARIALAQAHAEFARLGALPWADRALAELRAAGGRVAVQVGDVAALHVLSRQEQQVARVMADGATREEAASALFLSPESIERHLTAVHGKLGLRSRAELTRWFDLAAGIADPPLTPTDDLTAAIGVD